MNDSVSQPTTLVQTEISQQIFQWIALLLCTEIHGMQSRNPTDIANALTFPLVPPTGQTLSLSCEISHRLLDELAQHFVWTFMVPQGKILLTLVIPSLM